MCDTDAGRFTSPSSSMNAAFKNEHLVLCSADDTSQNILSKSTTSGCECMHVCVCVCAPVLCGSHIMQGHCLAVQQQCSQPGACAGAKRVCWHTIKKKSYTNTHTQHIQAQRKEQEEEKKRHKLIKTHTDTIIHTYTCAALRSWSIHDKSKSPPDVRQSNQRAWCSYGESQKPGGRQTMMWILNNNTMAPPA